MKKLTIIIFIISFSNILFLFCKPKNQQTKTSLSPTELTNNQPKTSSQKPINGELLGVVELGSSGFNSFIIEIDNSLNWEIKRKEYGASLIIEGFTNASKVNTGLQNYIQKIKSFGVKSNNIHFVVSSGAIKEKITETIIKELKQLGYVINIVTAEEEGIFALKAALPKKHKNDAFVVDIGSGNTKITYFIKDSIVSLETYGAKYFKKNIADSTVFKNVKTLSEKVPIEKTNNCFIIGGVPYKLAKKSRQAKERYTKLSTNIKDYSSLANEEGEKVKSGLNIFNAIIKTTNTKNVIFDWDANFTIGFLIDFIEKGNKIN